MNDGAAFEIGLAVLLAGIAAFAGLDWLDRRRSAPWTTRKYRKRGK